MKVVRARAMGMCFGVRDAIEVSRTLPNPSTITIYGELVHNETVNAELDQRGYLRQSEEKRTLPDTQGVMITAHGVSDKDRLALQHAGKNVYDTTCPLVRKAHEAALNVQGEGWFVVVAGKAGHVEVLGLTGDLTDYAILGDPGNAICYHRSRIAIICQTTLQPARANEIYAAVVEANPRAEIRLINTICRPTRERQSAMDELVGQVEAVVVVGGAHSNNTLQLLRKAEEAGLPAVRVSAYDELDEDWIMQFSVIGLTAGTSTPDAVIDEVERFITKVGTIDKPVFPSGIVTSELWVQWFRWNARNQGCIPWGSLPDVPADEVQKIAESLQEFQRGESSEGSTFLSRGFHHAMRTGDPTYYEALRLFIEEENRHGSYLGRFLQGVGVPLVQETSNDNVFRVLRKLGGLEGAIRVLISAEIIACTYYRAIGHATSSAVLKAICRQILHDEYKHLRFQNERLQIIETGRPALIRFLTGILQTIMLIVAMVIIWPRHGSAIRSGGYPFSRFCKETLRVYFQQIWQIRGMGFIMRKFARPEVTAQ